MFSDSRSKAGKFDVLTLPRVRHEDVNETMPPAVSQTVDLVSQAAATIDELVSYGQNIADVSERGILHYRQLAHSARDKVESLQKQLAALRNEYEDLLASSHDRITTLERTVQDQEKELEKLRAIMWPGLR